MDRSIAIGVAIPFSEDISSSPRSTRAFVDDWLVVEAMVEPLGIAMVTSRSLGAFEEIAAAWVPGH